MQIITPPNLNSIDPKILEQALINLLGKIPSREAKKLLKSIQLRQKLDKCCIIVGQSIDEKEKTYLLHLFRNIFPQSPAPVFEHDKKFEGGIRMFFHDEMVELNFEQIRQSLLGFIV